MKHAYPVQTPLGPMTLVESDGALTELRFGEHMEPDEIPSGGLLLHRAARQLEEYFEGKRTAFDLPLAPAGTLFQRSVWYALERIPYGETRSYGEIAAMVGKPRAARAVGMANHRNPLPIFIPCHRVIGADGRMVGYGGGLDKKVFLLKLETKAAR